MIYSMIDCCLLYTYILKKANLASITAKYHMRFTEVLTERLDYSAQVVKLTRMAADVYQETNNDYDNDDPVSKINAFLYGLEERIDQEILAPLLAEYPIIDNGVKIVSLTVSFKTIFGKPVKPISPERLALNVRTRMQDTLGYDLAGVSDTELLTQYINGHVHFTKEAEFYLYTKTKSALIRIDVFASKLASMLFLVKDPKFNQMAMRTFVNDLTAQLFHEVKHYLQANKVAGNLGSADKVDQVNKFYTGNPKSMRKTHKYNNTKVGYRLNANEMESWATNIASEIYNVFGEDQTAISRYMNAVSQGTTFSYKGVPVDTHLSFYHSEIFKPSYKLNTDRNVLWQKLLKDVYKNIQMFS
jgi:hypothetical protein